MTPWTGDRQWDALFKLLMWSLALGVLIGIAFAGTLFVLVSLIRGAR